MLYLYNMTNELNNNTMTTSRTKDEILNSVWDKMDAEHATAYNANDAQYLKIIEGVKLDLYNTLNTEDVWFDNVSNR